MTLIETVSSSLARWPQARARGNCVVVPTQCLFGSNGIVNVVVEGGTSSFIVHDDAAAIRSFEAAGGDLDNAPRLIRGLFRDRGMKVDDGGRIICPAVDFDGLVVAVALVANAAKEAEQHLMNRWHPVVRRKFKEVVRELLEAEFPTAWRKDRVIVGKSNKPHTFDFVIEINGQRQIVLDAVVPEPSAINTAVVRHLDIASTHGDQIVQRILYDDRLTWKSADLNVLQIGARTVPFSQAFDVLERLAA